MQKIIPIILLAVLLVPASQAYGQAADNAPTLTVSLQSETPFVYQDSEGFTVVVGVVENNNELTPVTNVQVQVKFYDDLNPQPIETVTDNDICRAPAGALQISWGFPHTQFAQLLPIPISPRHPFPWSALTLQVQRKTPWQSILVTYPWIPNSTLLEPWKTGGLQSQIQECTWQCMMHLFPQES